MQSVWRRVLRPVLFLLEPERAHHVAMRLFAIACVFPGFRALIARLFTVKDDRLAVKLAGLHLPNPIGLAAGFDKDARWIAPLGALGFGVLEVGTFTAEAQPGNPRPRLYRLPIDRALLNRFGFNNGGAAGAAARLAKRRRDVLVGANIGKTKRVANEDAVADYVASFELVAPHADYVVVNVSSPNTPGLRALQNRDALTAILRALRDRATVKRVPLFVKVAPDLSEAELDDVVDLAIELGLDGIVATNTTVSREGLRTPAIENLGAGGISGGPLTVRSRAIVRRLFRRAQGRLAIVGVGGVMTADDAWELLRAGATAVQVYTGFVYGGPSFVRDLNRGIARKLAERGLSNVVQVVGETSGEQEN